VLQHASHRSGHRTVGSFPISARTLAIGPAAALNITRRRTPGVVVLILVATLAIVRALAGG
jgi:hypothetical protein